MTVEVNMRVDMAKMITCVREIFANDEITIILIWTEKHTWTLLVLHGIVVVSYLL